MYPINLCETCLSLGRRMCEIDNDLLQSICPSLQLSVRKRRVCWECRGMVHKWIKFRDRVVKAQDILAHYNIFTSTSLSTLSLKTQRPVSIDDNIVLNMNSKSDVRVENEKECKDEIESITMVDPLDYENNDEIHRNHLSQDRKGNIHTKNLTVNPVKSCIKREKDRSVDTKEKKVTFTNDSSETDTADEFEDEVTEKIETKRKDSFQVVRVEKYRLLKLMNRAKNKRWFNLSKQPKCGTCIMLFESKESYKRHLKKHDEASGQHACEVCQQRFTTTERLKTHEEAHLNKCIECIDCHELFCSPWDFSAHYKDKHSHRDIMCWKCIKMFTTVSEYRKHRYEKHRALCTCEHCGKKFNKSALVQHIRFVHMDIEKTKCPICFKMVKGNMEHLRKTHIRNVHGPKVVDENSFCVECNIQFRSPWSYRSHVKVKHENVKSKCPQCGKFYLHLSAHMLTHSSDMNYPCPQCNKIFRWRSTLNNHVKYFHHGVPKPRTKTCNICQKSFGSNRQLRDHTHTHTGERPYVCMTCGDTFGHKAALFTHNKLKHKKNKQ